MVKLANYLNADLKPQDDFTNFKSNQYEAKVTGRMSSRQ